MDCFNENSSYITCPAICVLSQYSTCVISTALDPVNYRQAHCQLELAPPFGIQSKSYMGTLQIKIYTGLKREHFTCGNYSPPQTPIRIQTVISPHLRCFIKELCLYRLKQSSRFCSFLHPAPPFQTEMDCHSSTPQSQNHFLQDYKLLSRIQSYPILFMKGCN